MHMRRNGFNNLVKTAKASGAHLIPMTEAPDLVDDAHINLLSIRSLDGGPVFGVESEYPIRIENWRNVPDDQKFSIEVKDYRLVIENDDYSFILALSDEEPVTVKVPKMEGLCKVTVPTKKVQNGVKTLKGICDHVTFESDGERLVMSNRTDTDEIRITLADCDEVFTVKFPFDYVERMSKVLVGDVRMELGTDYPTVWIWCDGFYEYRYVLAPRIESA